MGIMMLDDSRKERNLGTIIVSEMFSPEKEEQEVSASDAKMEAMKVFIASVHSREVERAVDALSEFISLCD